MVFSGDTATQLKKINVGLLLWFSVLAPLDEMTVSFFEWKYADIYLCRFRFGLFLSMADILLFGLCHFLDIKQNINQMPRRCSASCRPASAPSNSAKRTCSMFSKISCSCNFLHTVPSGRPFTIAFTCTDPSCNSAFSETSQWQMNASKTCEQVFELV